MVLSLYWVGKFLRWELNIEIILVAGSVNKNSFVIIVGIVLIAYTYSKYLSVGYQTEFYSCAQNNVYLALFLLNRIWLQRIVWNF